MNDLFFDYEYLLKHKKEICEELMHREALIEKKIAILAGSTIGELKEFLTVFLLYYGIKPQFWEGGYNRIYEDACFQNTELEQFQPDYIYIHMTFKNIMFFDSDESCAADKLEKEKTRFKTIWEELEHRYHCSIIQNNIEYPKYRVCGNAARYHEDGIIAYIDGINRFIHENIKHGSSLFLNDINYISSCMGLMEWYDDRLWHLYKYAVGMKALPYVAHSISSIIKSTVGKNKKLVICDLDNTLWKGAVGELGADKIEIGTDTPHGEMYLKTQRYLKQLSSFGVALAICSKNEYEKGISGFSNKGCLLRESDFIAKKINWQDKYKNIEQIFKEVNLLRQSAVFIDDNPVECDSVEAFLPGISVALADSPKSLLTKLELESYFEITYESEEDKKRNDYYRENAERALLREVYESYDEYLGSLNMSCTFSPVNSRNADRTFQLLNKTNQFNFTGKKFSSGEILEIQCDDSFLTLTAVLDDKFGSNGLVSAVVGRITDDTLHLIQWVMSCRVFKRGLEFAVLEKIVKLCMERKLNYICGYYHKTGKNQPAEDFYRKSGFTEIGREGEMGRWKMEVSSQLTFHHKIECREIRENI